MKKQSKDDKELETIGNERGRAGRVDNASAARRRLLVEQLMIKKLTPRQIAQAVKANYKTVLNDVKIIQTEWLKADIPWLHRAQLARIECEQTFRQQLARLFTHLQDKDMSKKELLYVEELVRRVSKDCFETMRAIDPEEYMEKKIHQKWNELMQSYLEGPPHAKRFMDEIH